MIPHREIAPAKLNLALHVRAKLPDGRHAIETVFAFCTDGDRLGAEPYPGFVLSIDGPFGPDLNTDHHTSVEQAAGRLAWHAGVPMHARLHLEKNLPVASGIGGGSADAAAALRLLTSLWRIDPAHATAVAPELGSDVPACLLSITARGESAGDQLTPIALPELSGAPVLLVNPRVQLSTAVVFAGWDGQDRGALGDWREGRNDLQDSAIARAPLVATVLAWLAAQRGASFVRMSGSGATCFALFETEAQRDEAATAVPREWWHLATALR